MFPFPFGPPLALGRKERPPSRPARQSKHLSTTAPSGLHLRSGPGKSYHPVDAQHRTLSQGTRLFVEEARSLPDGTVWAYVQVLSGPLNGRHGWVDTEWTRYV